MRECTINLYQNTGQVTPGALLAMTSGVIEEMADLSQEIDGGEKGLVKVARGQFTCRVVDPDGSVWAFIRGQLTLIPGITGWQPDTTYLVGAAVMANGGAYLCQALGRSATDGPGPSGTASAIVDGTVTWAYTPNSGLLPPWLEVYVEGTRVFLGLVDPSMLVQTTSADEEGVEVGANDWSISLSNVYLGAPTASPWLPSTPYRGGQQVLNGGSCYVCTTAGTSAAAGGPTGIGSDILDGTVRWAFVQPTWKRTIPPQAHHEDIPDPQPGWSYPNVYLRLGQFSNAAFITNPCLGFQRTAVVTMSRPIFTYAPIANPPWFSTETEGGQRQQYPGATYLDADGQTWTYQVVGHGHDDIDLYGWIIAQAWTTPGTAGTLTALPNANFPPGMILRAPTGLWQVSPDGHSWGSVYDASYDSPFFTVLDCVKGNGVYPARGASQGATEVLLSSNPWPTFTKASGQWTADFSLYSAVLSDVTYWETAVAVPENPSPECHLIALKSVDGIQVGDTLATTATDSSNSWTIAGVDPILCAVATVEPVSDLPLGSRLYWDSSSQDELVSEDPRTILTRAAYPFTVDLSDFAAPETPDPVFGFISSPRAVGDVWATLTGLKASQAGNWGVNPVTCQSWTGDPDVGWTLTSETAYQPTADWTGQLAAAPAFLMPYVPANPFERLRNRAYSDVAYRQENNGLIVLNGHWVNGIFVQTLASGAYQYVEGGVTYSTAGGANFTPWSPSGADRAGVLTVYDYLQMRQINVNGAALQVLHWTSASASAEIGTYAWPGGRLIQSLVPMLGQPGAYLAYTVDGAGANPTLELWGLAGGLLAPAWPVLAALQGGSLVTTPWAVYLVGASAIAQVILTDGALAPVTQYFVDQVSCFFANTLVARTAGEFMVFGRYDTGTTDSDRTTITRLLRVATDLTPSLGGSVFLAEKISEGAPTVIGAVRDPGKPGRVVGHYGGSLWQLDTQVPMALGRFVPGGLDAMSLIEHICQLYACIAVPDANGVLRIVSRAADSGLIHLTVPQVSIKETRSWPEFSSIVRVTVGDDLRYDAFGQQGGGQMDMSEHPLVSTLSGCSTLAQGMIAWFGQPRQITEEEWAAEDLDTAAVWEALPLFSRISVNGGPPVRLMARSCNYHDGSATVRTLGA